MKKLLLVLIIPFLSFGQCDVNYEQAPFLADPDGSYNMQIIDGSLSLEPFNENYDTLTAFPTALETTAYEAVIGVRIPNDTSFVYDLGSGPQLFENVQINSMSINSVAGLPPGFTWECVGGPTSPEDCSWTGGDYGCIRFYSDGTVLSGLEGVYPLNILLDVSANYDLFGVPIPIDLTVDDLLDYYVLVVDETEPVYGCIDAQAINYNGDANTDDGSCEYDCEYLLTWDSYLNNPEISNYYCGTWVGMGLGGYSIEQAEGYGYICDCVVEGCGDENACNYNPNSTVYLTDYYGNGSFWCEYPAETYLDCNGVCLNDTDGNGVCNELEIPGCTDPNACNYNDTATEENDSCLYLDLDDICETCVNGIIVDNDTDDDGVCDEDEINGCTDFSACNYDSSATEDDSSCVSVDGICETCVNGVIIDNDADDDGVCDEDEINGCTDFSACNYNSFSTENDGSCIYIQNSCDFCQDMNGDGIGEIIDNDSDDDGICNEFDIAGCTNANNCNYDINATEYESGSCACLLSDFTLNICYTSVEDNNVVLYWNKFTGNCSFSVFEQTSPSSWTTYETEEPFNCSTYNIYKQNPFGDFIWLNTVQSLDDNLSYIDEDANALQQSYSYIITTLDECGNETVLDQINQHKTIHLSSNQGINGEVNLIWNSYEGFDYNVFDIWRSNNNNNFELIGQVSIDNFTYSDVAPPAGQNQYFVSVTQLDECTIFQDGRSFLNSSSSNRINVNSVSLEEAENSKKTIKITDILGRKINNNKGFQLQIYDDGSVEKKYLIK